ncbi:hypothetical protein NQ318_017160 [Aromia moschata]|uniref:Uncharacterized protein n=1 Tax=Aromia moschata TaxID=1265417 RepID=A0AAV8YQ96_9CUCU|nr:hypothetical protein NQ318_017160 [Aromia moschata]
MLQLTLLATCADIRNFSRQLPETCESREAADGGLLVHSQQRCAAGGQQADYAPHKLRQIRAASHLNGPYLNVNNRTSKNMYLKFQVKILTLSVKKERQTLTCCPSDFGAYPVALLRLE